MSKRILEAGLRVVLGFVFVTAAAEKLWRTEELAEQATIYTALVAGRISVHYAMVAVELALGLWLITGFWYRASTLMALVILSAFTALIVLELTQPEPRSCGCGSTIYAIPIGQAPTAHGSLWWSLSRNVIWMAMAACVAIGGRSRNMDGEVQPSIAPMA